MFTGMTTFDLIVVGGGPAGAAATLYAKRHGLRTLLLDKASFPRDKICGDALSGKSISVLDELGLLDELHQLPGALIKEIVFGSPSHVDAHIDLKRYDHRDAMTGRVLPGGGFVIRRQIFDHFLFNKARLAADRCIEGFSVRDLIFEDGAVCGVRGESSGEHAEFRAPVVLGCDGFSSVVARKTGLYQHDSRHGVVALRCYFENVKGLTKQIELHLVEEALPGYFWIFPLDNNCANVGIGTLHRHIRKRHAKLKTALDTVIGRAPFRKRFADASPLEEPVGWNLPLGSRHRQCYGDGFMLLGDAAGLIDPFTGEGIGNALYSGRIAAEVAAQAVASGDCSAAVMRNYDERLWGAIGNELEAGTRLQQLGRWRPLLNYVFTRAARDETVSDHICGMIANVVPKQEMTSPLYYLKLLMSRSPRGS